MKNALNSMGIMERRKYFGKFGIKKPNNLYHQNEEKEKSLNSRSRSTKLIT